MPTKHKVTRVEKLVEIDVLVSSIEAYVQKHEDQILSTLMLAGFEFNPDDELDGQGPKAILKELERILFISIMGVLAVPYRAPRKIIAVLEGIACHPNRRSGGLSVSWRAFCRSTMGTPDW